MAIPNRGIVLRQLDRLFSEGTLAGLGDSQLLERYLTRRDEAAFETLVSLHGPMVLGLCRRILPRPARHRGCLPGDVLGARPQGTGASRPRSFVELALWSRLPSRDASANQHAAPPRPRDRNRKPGYSGGPRKPGPHGDRTALDQELSRLPAKYRAALVMCYLRGKTHDQAAEELCCPVGTVRSRLARGRDLLKRRLTSRGYAPSAAVLGPGSCAPGPPSDRISTSRAVSATVEAALGIGAFKTIQAGAAAASVLALTQGVLTSMKLAQLKWIGLAIVTGSLSAAGAIVVAAGGAQSSKTPADAGSVAVALASPSQDAAPSTEQRKSFTRPTQGTTEQRLRKLEQMLEQLIDSTDGTKYMPREVLDPDAATLDRLEDKIGLLLRRHEMTSRARIAGSQATTSSTSTSTPAAVTRTAGSTSSTTSSMNFQPALSTATTRKAVENQVTGALVRELEAQLRLAIAEQKLAIPELKPPSHPNNPEKRQAFRGEVALRWPPCKESTTIFERKLRGSVSRSRRKRLRWKRLTPSETSPPLWSRATSA